MKKTLILLALVQVQVSFANLTDYIVSHRDFIPPNEFSAIGLPVYEQRQSNLLFKASLCLPGNPLFPLSQIEVNGNNIKVLAGHKRSVKVITCTPPPPPSYYKIADIPPLAVGTYNLSYYFIPSDVTFPPDNADLPNYLVTNFSFNVLAVTPVNSLSVWSIAILTLMLFLMGYIGLKVPRHSK